jgi:hypothetical protein
MSDEERRVGRLSVAFPQSLRFPFEDLAWAESISTPPWPRRSPGSGWAFSSPVSWFAYRYWRKRHPPPVPEPERSYSQRLEQRLAKNQGAAKRKRRGGSAKSRPRRHG